MYKMHIIKLILITYLMSIATQPLPWSEKLRSKIEKAVSISLATESFKIKPLHVNNNLEAGTTMDLPPSPQRGDGGRQAFSPYLRRAGTQYERCF